MPSKYKYSRKKKTKRTKRTHRNNRYTRSKSKQKIYNMRGCSCKHSKHCGKRGGSKPIGGFVIHKGGFTTPNALVGSPYDINKGGNYYGPEYKSAGFDYPRQMQLRGGSASGGIVPQNLTNVGRNVVNSGQSIYNGVMGYKAPESIWPWEGQGMHR